MAFLLSCDVKTCGAIIQQAEAGQPALAGKQHTYCPSCAAYIAAVDQEMMTVTTIRSLELANELTALRDQKIAAALPQQHGGTGLKADWRVEVPDYEAPNP